MFAAIDGCACVVPHLIAAGEDKDARTRSNFGGEYEGYTALMYAAWYQQWAAVTALLFAGTNADLIVEVRCWDHVAMLTSADAAAAASAEPARIGSTLSAWDIEEKSQPKEYSGKKLAHRVGKSWKYHEAARRVSEVKERKAQNEAALRMAAQEGRTATVTALVVVGVDLNCTDEYGWTALHEASLKGHTETVKALVAAGADVHSTTNQQRAHHPDG